MEGEDTANEDEDADGCFGRFFFDEGEDAAAAVEEDEVEVSRLRGDEAADRDLYRFMSKTVTDLSRRR